MPRITPDFLDELRSRLRPSDVIGRHVKLQKQGREWRGLSPFTNEKTPSFYVNDEKARYFDFSSGKSGDIVGFLMDTQKLSFVEAVTRLAEQAGMDIPEDTPQDRQREQKAKGLIEACALAAHFFAEMLKRIDGRKARDYLEMRKVSAAQQKAFNVGYAPASRTALKDYLVNKGFQVPMLIEAGLVIQPDNGNAPYDRFRDRLMFPITDARDRVIAFGGRALEKNVQAKYLNSPETPLFHKGNILYNYMNARRHAAELPKETGQQLIVCEGYMDVVALADAGFGQAVAPLGTAVTERHLELMWRACDEPVFCFDGDRAGQKAAFRAIDRALPILKPGKSIRFAFLPEGQDPDDVVKQAGAGAFGEILARAEPLADVLWRRERELETLDTPEKKAAFRARLRTTVKAIADKDVRSAYGDYFSGKFSERPEKPRFQKKAWLPQAKKGPQALAGIEVSQALKAQMQGRRVTSNETAQWQREALLVMTLINHPALFEHQEENILDLRLRDRDLSLLLNFTLDMINNNPELDTEGLTHQINKVAQLSGTLELLLTNPLLKLTKFTRSDAPLAEAERGWANTLSINLHQGALRAEENEAAAEAFLDERSEIRWRVAHAHRQSVVADAKEASDSESGATTQVAGKN